MENNVYEGCTYLNIIINYKRAINYTELQWEVEHPIITELVMPKIS